MKKILFAFLGFFLLLVPLAFAQTTNQASSDNANGSQTVQIMPIEPLPPPLRIRQQNFLGQDQSYTVNFRGNGEAVVSFKTVIANLEDQPLSQINLQFPNSIHPRDIAVFQLSQHNLPCIRWKPPIDQTLVSPTPTPYSLMYNDLYPNKQLLQPNRPFYPPKPIQICEEYQQPDFTNIDSYNTSYQRAMFDLQKDNSLLITLPKPIPANESGSYFVYFRTFDYTQKTFFDAYTFTLETLKTKDTINTLTVGINTDADYLLRDAKGKINYQQQNTASSLPLGAFARTAIQSQQLNDFYNNIGQGNITKTESDLGSDETFKIQGMYADAQWKLYGKEIMTTIVIVIVILALLIVCIKLVLQKMSKHHDEPEVPNTTKLFMASLGISFASIFLLFLYTMGIYFMSMFFPLFVNNIILLIAVFAISMAVFAFFLFVPAVTIGLRKGLNWGINTFGFTILWSIVFFIVAVGIMFLFSNRSPYPGPIPYNGLMNNTVPNSDNSNNNGVMGAHTQTTPQNRSKGY